MSELLKEKKTVLRKLYKLFNTKTLVSIFVRNSIHTVLILPCFKKQGKHINNILFLVLNNLVFLTSRLQHTKKKQIIYMNKNVRRSTYSR